MPLACIEQFDSILCCKCHVAVAGMAIKGSNLDAKLVCGWCTEELKMALEFMGITTNEEIKEQREKAKQNAWPTNKKYQTELAKRCKLHRKVYDNTIEAHIERCYIVFNLSKAKKEIPIPDPADDILDEDGNVIGNSKVKIKRTRKKVKDKNILDDLFDDINI